MAEVGQIEFKHGSRSSFIELLCQGWLVACRLVVWRVKPNLRHTPSLPTVAATAATAVTTAVYHRLRLHTAFITSSIATAPSLPLEPQAAR